MAKAPDETFEVLVPVDVEDIFYQGLDDDPDFVVDKLELKGMKSFFLIQHSTTILYLNLSFRSKSQFWRHIT